MTINCHFQSTSRKVLMYMLSVLILRLELIDQKEIAVLILDVIFARFPTEQIRNRYVAKVNLETQMIIPLG